jgi:hypothetical protein
VVSSILCIDAKSHALSVWHTPQHHFSRSHASVWLSHA